MSNLIWACNYIIDKDIFVQNISAKKNKVNY